jgi:hypothetical protein
MHFRPLRDDFMDSDSESDDILDSPIRSEIQTPTPSDSPVKTPKVRFGQVSVCPDIPYRNQRALSST